MVKVEIELKEEWFTDREYLLYQTLYMQDGMSAEDAKKVANATITAIRDAKEPIKLDVLGYFGMDQDYQQHVDICNAECDPDDRKENDEPHVVIRNIMEAIVNTKLEEVLIGKPCD